MRHHGNEGAIKQVIKESYREMMAREARDEILEFIGICYCDNLDGFDEEEFNNVMDTYEEYNGIRRHNNTYIL